MSTEAIIRRGEKIQLPTKRVLPLHDHPDGGKFAVWMENGKLYGWREGKEFEPSREEVEHYLLLEIRAGRRRRRKGNER